MGLKGALTQSRFRNHSYTPELDWVRHTSQPCYRYTAYCRGDLHQVQVRLHSGTNYRSLVIFVRKIHEDCRERKNIEAYSIGLRIQLQQGYIQDRGK